jgi:glyoxylase-like metal-dependent hydrolase (beta-lactamase superfamily II)
LALNFDVHWIHGSPDCRQTTDPLLQTHQAESATFIFRQSKCSSFEAPFMYLLIGDRRSLLLDTGAPTPSGVLPIRVTVDAIMARHAAAGRHELIVAHSHAHGDHAAADGQFAGRPDTLVVRPRRADIQARFAIDRWPEDSGTLDLGGRVLTILPIPGHEDLHIAVHDSKTGLMLTGDTFYPGLLVVNDWPAYSASALRLEAFVRSHDVSVLLGAHIEMRSSGQLFPLGTTFQPDEHPLQLLPRDLLRWADACGRLGVNASGQHAFPNFVIDIRRAEAFLE